MVLNKPALTFSLATEDQLGLVNRFYRTNGHKGKCGRNDRVYIARDSQAIVAAVRFSEKVDVWLLRGLWVAVSQRRQGIGGMLLQYCLPEFNKPVWCYPYEHLAAFYKQYGFCEQHPETAPNDIATQWQAYRQRGHTFTLMQYLPE